MPTEPTLNIGFLLSGGHSFVSSVDSDEHSLPPLSFDDVVFLDYQFPLSVPLIIFPFPLVYLHSIFANAEALSPAILHLSLVFICTVLVLCIRFGLAMLELAAMSKVNLVAPPLCFSFIDPL